MNLNKHFQSYLIIYQIKNATSLSLNIKEYSHIFANKINENLTII